VLRRVWHSARIAERWDLYSLAVVAICSFIVEIATKYSGVDLLSVAVALLAVVLLRLREAVEHIKYDSPVEHLTFEALRDLDVLASNAREIWLHTGASLSDLLGLDIDSTRRMIRRLCGEHTRVRILISEPWASSYQSSRTPELVSAIGPTALLIDALTAELDTLAELVHPDARSDIEIHLADYPQPYSIIGFNPRDDDGHIIVKLPEYNPSGKTPTLSLFAADNRKSYAHFLNEALRLWGQGSISVDSALIRDIVSRYRRPLTVNPRPGTHRSSE
jgi:hypothetical protein